jgi:arylsulfatase A-like enzyme
MKIKYALILPALSLLGGSLAAGEKAPAARPNIIVIYTDDHGYADLGCMGIMNDVKTPNIDALAAAGVRMTAGYVTAPQCSPSRCGLISGQYQGKFGMDNNRSWRAVPTLQKRFFALQTLPGRLKTAGYVTGMAGKSHLGSDDSAELVRLGFDKAFFKHSNAPGHWNMDLTGNDIAPRVQKGGNYHLEMITTFACTFVERFKAQPFFFYLAYRAPHVPLDAPKKYLARFPGQMPEERRKALGAISCIDDGVGRIMETLRKNGLEEHTLVFVISDNGAPIGLTTPQMRAKGSADWPGSLNDPLNGGKGMLIEGGIRTPFVVSWKGTIPGGQVYPHPVISLDVAATANALAGLPDDAALDGVNLLPYLTGMDAGRPHDVLYWRWFGQSAIRKGDWKYLACGNRQYLFNLATDLEEQHNLLPQQPELGRNLRAQLEQWSQTLIPPGLGPVEMTGPARRYFDFYLDGKQTAAPAPDDAPGTGARRRGKAKVPAKADDADE